jgi:hypothetical protein
MIIMQGSSLSSASSTVNGRRPFQANNSIIQNQSGQLGLKLKRARFLKLPQRAPSRSFVKVLFPKSHMLPNCTPRRGYHGPPFVETLPRRRRSQVRRRRDSEIHLPMQKLLPSHLETCENARLELKFNVVTMWASTLAANITRRSSWTTSWAVSGDYLMLRCTKPGMTYRDVPDCQVTWQEFAQIR